MWEIEETNLFKKQNIVLIHSDYEVLAFHDFPILFSGKSIHGSRIIGSFVEHLENEDVYLHSLADEKTYSKFENQIITYRELLKEAELIFNVRVNAAEEVKIYWINYEDIPQDYLPSEDAKCPALTIQKTRLEFEASLTNGRADQHLLAPETATSFTKNWATIFRDIFKLDGLKELRSNVSLFAHDNMLLAPGSVKINYQIDVKESSAQSSLLFDVTKCNTFAEQYVIYCLHHLTNDAPVLAKQNYSQLPAFQSLIDIYLESSEHLAKSRQYYEEHLSQNLLKAARKLGSIGDGLGEDVGAVEISSLSDTISQSLGVFDGQVASEIETSLEEVEKIEGKVITTDSEPTVYQGVQIYDLNTNSRKGRALLPAVGKTQPKPRIIISGDEPLDHTKYTRSLYLDEVIEVKAIGTKVDNIAKKLEIVFESEDISESEQPQIESLLDKRPRAITLQAEDDET